AGVLRGRRAPPMPRPRAPHPPPCPRPPASTVDSRLWTDSRLPTLDSRLERARRHGARDADPETPRSARRDRRRGKMPLRSNPGADAAVVLARGIAPINWRRPDGFGIGGTLEADRRDPLPSPHFSSPQSRRRFLPPSRPAFTPSGRCVCGVAARPRCRRRAPLDPRLDSRPPTRLSTPDSGLTLASRLSTPDSRARAGTALAMLTPRHLALRAVIAGA